MTEHNLDRPQRPLGDLGSVQVLLAEYNVLQTEIIHRMNNGFQLMAVAAVVFALLVQLLAQRHFWLFGTSSLIAVTAIVAATRLTFYYIGEAAERIKQIEREVNTRAGEVLLVHQSRIGGHARGYLWRALLGRQSKKSTAG